MVAEVRNVAVCTETQGLVNGHSLRVTGAHRLALAGVNETRIITFGQGASVAFRKYVRKAVLGINDGKVYEAFEAKAQGTGTPQLKAEFKNQVLANPMERLGETEWATKLQSFLAEAHCKEQKMEGRELPKLCMSEAGITHIVADCRLTRCGWHWSRTENCEPVADIAGTCRKCSVRWGST